MYGPIPKVGGAVDVRGGSALPCVWDCVLSGLDMLVVECNCIGWIRQGDSPNACMSVCFCSGVIWMLSGIWMLDEHARAIHGESSDVPMQGSFPPA